MYSLPPGSTVTNGDTSDASDLNSPLADLEADMNIPRPIVAGGTGASSASAALVNLGLTATAAEINVLDGVTASTAELNILDGVTASTAELNVLDGITATVTELNYTDGVTSAIQTQLDDKQAVVVRAWVNFNGTGTVAIRASSNVSSITDNGTGDYTVNFTNAMSDANYAVVATMGTTTNGGAVRLRDNFTPTTTQVWVQTLNNSGALVDANFVNVAVFR